MWFLWLVFGLLLVLFGFYIYTQIKVRTAERNYPPIGNFIEANGVRLHYVRKGSGRPVVLLHGHDGFLQDWTLTVFDQLAQEYDVIAFDRPGHGYSDRPKNSSTPFAQARLIHEALVKLGVEKPLIIGHSWSGSLVLAYALEYPEEVSGIVSLAGAVYSSDGPLPWFVRLPLLPWIGTVIASTIWFPLSRGVIRQLVGMAYYPEQMQLNYIRAAQALWQRRPLQIKAWAEDIKGLASDNANFSKRYSEIRVPLVIVNGDSDLEVPAQYNAIPLHKQIPHSKLIILPNVGHEIPHTRPEAVIEAIQFAFAQKTRP